MPADVPPSPSSRRTITNYGCNFFHTPCLRFDYFSWISSPIASCSRNLFSYIASLLCLAYHAFVPLFTSHCGKHVFLSFLLFVSCFSDFFLSSCDYLLDVNSFCVLTSLPPTLYVFLSFFVILAFFSYISFMSSYHGSSLRLPLMSLYLSLLVFMVPMFVSNSR